MTYTVYGYPPQATRYGYGYSYHPPPPDAKPGSCMRQYGKAQGQKKKKDVEEEKKKYEEMWQKIRGVPYNGWMGWPGAPPVAGPSGQQYMALYQRPSPYGYYTYPP
ncbi:hypothetical protein IAR50_005199 [Cryptococcus sp. DSM 104548]